MEHVADNLSLKGKSALVSGASKGIGRSIAMQLAGRGAHIVAVARGRSGLENLVASLPEGNHRIISVDLTEKEGIDVLHRDCLESGFPDIVVANVHNRRPLKKTNSLSSDGAVSIAENIDYLLKILPESIDSQRKNDFGRWIGIGSMISRMGGPGQMQYMAAKSLLSSLIKAIAIENGEHNITGNMVLPGLIDTEGLRGAYPGKTIDMLSRMNVMNRAGRPEEVAHAVAFLADPLASYITGIEIPVCGGYDLSWPMIHDLRKDQRKGDEETV